MDSNFRSKFTLERNDFGGFNSSLATISTAITCISSLCRTKLNPHQTYMSEDIRTVLFEGGVVTLYARDVILTDGQTQDWIR